MTPRTIIDKILDVTGLVCPMPTVMTSKTLKDMKKGGILQIISNDMTTRQTIPSICSEEGYSLLDQKEKEGLLYFTVKK